MEKKRTIRRPTGTALTDMEAAFVAAFDGNATAAARAAGYASPDVKGPLLLRKKKIQNAIEHRRARSNAGLIATRERRQQWWTEVMLDERRKMADRLKASELLAKSEGDFLERIQHSADNSFADLLKAARERIERG